MPVYWLIILVLGIGTAGFVAGRMRALGTAGGDSRNLHSLPNYYGSNVFLKAIVPGYLVMIVWLIAQPLLVGSQIASMIPDSEIREGSSIGLVMAEVRRTAEGLDNAVAAGMMDEATARSARIDLTDMTQRLKDAGQIVTSQITQPVLAAAQQYRVSMATGALWMAIVTALVTLGGAAWGVLQSDKMFRARNVVEQGVLAMLIGCAMIAILTTVGIVLSLIFNTVEFFRLYPASEFFFLLEWAPSFSGRGGASSLGIIPLLWGTLYISLVALLVAVPIGLFAAIYLSEYASPAVRSFAKPMLEVLAGIPTIVYGLFALLTIGPILVSVFGNEAQLANALFRVPVAVVFALVIGVLTTILTMLIARKFVTDDTTVTYAGIGVGVLAGAAFLAIYFGNVGTGEGIMSGQRAVMTAGIAMGIMLIPFVSSLSDDIINAVPQAMRDGSYGLGATKSETIQQVILPAALPGIVGAILLAASRAIGETMIVVLGAGAAARLSVNPFEALTTITAKIVSQLTGDSDFASPEALVAFALGITLFVMTLALNVFALYIVRKYREQYQ